MKRLILNSPDESNHSRSTLVPVYIILKELLRFVGANSHQGRAFKEGLNDYFRVDSPSKTSLFSSKNNLITYKIHRIYKTAKLQCKCVTHFDYLIINLISYLLNQSLVYVEFSFDVINWPIQ